jgi:hypothetical protein
MTLRLPGRIGRMGLRRGAVRLPFAAGLCLGAGALIALGIGATLPPSPAGEEEDRPTATISPADSPVVSVRPVRPLPGEEPRRAERGPRRSNETGQQPRRRSSPGPAPQATPTTTDALPPGSSGTVTVVTTPGVKTFVYLNGGSLLGEAPLKGTTIPAGRQKLTFWTPSVGGRSSRTVDVKPGQSALVVENVRPSPKYEDSSAEPHAAKEEVPPSEPQPDAAPR